MKKTVTRQKWVNDTKLARKVHKVVENTDMVSDVPNQILVEYEKEVDKFIYIAPVSGVYIISSDFGNSTVIVSSGDDIEISGKNWATITRIK